MLAPVRLFATHRWASAELCQGRTARSQLLARASVVGPPGSKTHHSIYLYLFGLACVVYN